MRNIKREKLISSYIVIVKCACLFVLAERWPQLHATKKPYTIYTSNITIFEKKNIIYLLAEVKSTILIGWIAVKIQIHVIKHFCFYSRFILPFHKLWCVSRCRINKPKNEMNTWKWTLTQMPLHGRFTRKLSSPDTKPYQTIAHTKFIFPFLGIYIFLIVWFSLAIN